MKKFTVGALMLVIAATLTACETVEGFGRDLEKVGGKIEKAADKEPKATEED